jgi:DNA-binding transcriptional LysR family regulator
MKLLQPLKLFLLTAQTGSISAAARQQNMSPAAASAALKRLESELEAPLFIRSTRHLRLSTEGERFLDHCMIALQTLEEGVGALADGRGLVSGSLEISAPSDLGRNQLHDWLIRFQARFPALRIGLRLSDRLTNFYREPVDVALRYGEPPDSSLIALPLARDNARVLCAAPAYLERVAPIEDIADLARHNCLCLFIGDQVNNRWRFFRGGDEYSIEVQGDRVSDDSDIIRRWTLAGLGVAYRSALDVADELRSGALVRLCPQWRGEAAPLNMICPDRRLLSAAVRELYAGLSEFYAERLRLAAS